ncbi:hypothetical protein SMZ43_003931 [Cronobacter dublinensis]|nr:hypothetical protein [Cronobacter dublinensis]
MSTMLYREGRGTRVWGKELESKVVNDDEVKSHIDNGWFEHPDEVKQEGHFNDEGPVIGENKDMGEVSDGYHTFNELYAHRVRLFSALMNAYPSISWWSRKHHDGEEWEGWIIAGIDTPDGPATYHLPEDEIENLPEGTELECGKEWDGHEADDVLIRLLSLKQDKPEPEAEIKERKKPGRKPKAGSDESDD